MKVLLLTVFVAYCLFPVLLRGAPTPGGTICGYTDRLQAVTCGHAHNASAAPADFPFVCGLTFRSRQSLLVGLQDLENVLVSNTPEPELDWPNHMPQDDTLPNETDSQVETLVSDLAKYQLDVFCVGEAVATLPYFKSIAQDPTLCDVVAYGRDVACSIGEHTGAAADVSELEGRANCSHFYWPKFLHENISSATNAYSVAMVRRFRNYVTSWDTVCP